MGYSIYPAPGAADAKIFETLQHSSGTFTVDCSVNKTVILDVDDAYFTPTRKNLTYVGGANNAVSLSATTTSVNFSINGLTGGVASAPAQGDIVIVAFTIAADQQKSIIFNNGFTQLDGLYSNGTTHDTNLRVAYKVMGSTPDTSVSITTDMYADFSYSWAVHVWRGIDTSSPLDVAVATDMSTGSSRANPPSITTITDNSVVVAIGAGASPNTTAVNYTSSDLSNFRTSAVQDNNSTVIGMGSAVVSTAGVFDPSVFGDSTSNSVCSWAAVTLAIRPGLNSTNAATINFSNIPVEKKEITVNLSRSGSMPNDLPLVWQSGIFDFIGQTSLSPGNAIVQDFFTLGNVLYSSSPTDAKIQKTDIIKSTQAWTVPADVTKVEVILCGGGSSGSWGGNARGGAGSVDFSVLTVSPSTSYTITIGAGGSTASGSGSNSSFGALLTVAGAAYDAPVGRGGSGGNTPSNATAGHQTSSGATGYQGFGGGGGGASLVSGQSPSPGLDGGGRGASVALGVNGENGKINSGAGGGAGASSTYIQGNGGSGVCVIKYWSAL